MAAGLLSFVSRFLRHANVRHGRVVIACSGGPDSMALAHAIHALAQGHQLQVTLAHLNHQLRGAHSDADEAAVATLAHQLGIEFEVRRVNVAGAADRKKENLEATARAIRYDWLGHVGQMLGAKWIATGHTADDQAETVLHHLLRGTGLRGLRGIAGTKQVTAEVVLVRPLLEVTRQQVLAYLNEHGLIPRHDVTNDDVTLTRNRIRHELLPVLKQDYNPQVVAALARVAEQVQDYWPEREAEISRRLTEAEAPRAGHAIVLRAEPLGALARSVVVGVFYAIWEREGWHRQEMSHEHWQLLAEVVTGERAAIDLPGGVRCVRRGDVVTLEPRSVGPEKR